MRTRLLRVAAPLAVLLLMSAALLPPGRIGGEAPEDHTAIERRALAAAGEGKHAEAAALWEQFLDRAPRPIEGCPQIGLSYRGAGNAQGSIRAFERCLALDPLNADSILYLAHALEIDTQRGRASGLYRRGLEIAPLNPDLALGLGRIALHEERFTEARTTAQAVLDRSPDHPDALLLLGLAHLRAGDAKSARPVLERGARIAPNDPEFKHVLGQLPPEQVGRP
jgi:tetratricopeptide (TPR) repeat protein